MKTRNELKYKNYQINYDAYIRFTTSQQSSNNSLVDSQLIKNMIDLLLKYDAKDRGIIPFNVQLAFNTLKSLVILEEIDDSNLTDPKQI